MAKPFSAKTNPSQYEEFLIRKFQIAEKWVFVFDGLFGKTAIRQTYQALRGIDYRWVGQESEELTHTVRWTHRFPALDPSSSQIARTISEIVQTSFPDEKLKLGNVYGNFSTFGEMFYGHTDGPAGYTSLYYANREWDPAWHGETFFCSDDHEALHVVAPRPGRVVVFDSRIVHRASPPSRECYEPRMNIAFKFVPDRPSSPNSSKTNRKKNIAAEARATRAFERFTSTVIRRR